MGKCHITRFAGPPTETPLESGHHWIDTLNKQEYSSVGTDSPLDWVLQDAGAAVTSGITAHLAAPNPHTQYQTIADAAAYEATVTAEQATQDAATVAAAAVGAAAGAAATANASAIATNVTDIATKYDASNPNGYETPAELDARDTANRDRANHTGLQSVTTLSDLLPLLYDQVASNIVPRINDNTAVQTYLTDTFSIPAQGDYIASVTFLYSHDSGTNDFIGDFIVDGTSHQVVRHEPQDSAGVGILAQNVEDNITENTGTDQRFPGIREVYLENQPAGDIDISLDWNTSANGVESTIYNAVIRVKRVNI